MSDLSRKHLLAFVVFFIALFAILFAGVVQGAQPEHATACHGAIRACCAANTTELD
jgi:hypothetical protein